MVLDLKQKAPFFQATAFSCGIQRVMAWCHLEELRPRAREILAPHPGREAWIASQPRDVPRIGTGSQDRKPSALTGLQAGKELKVAPLCSLPKLSPPWHGQHKTAAARWGREDHGSGAMGLDGVCSPSGIFRHLFPYLS